MTKQEKIGFVYNLVLFVLNLIVGFIYTPTLIFFLGLEDYAVFVIVGSLIGYLALTDFGIHGTVIRYVSKYRLTKDEEGQSQFLGALFVIYSFIALLILVISFFLFNNLQLFFPNYSNLTSNISIIFILLIINLVLSLPLGIFPNLIEGYGVFTITKISKIIHLVSRTLLILLLFNLNIGFNLFQLVLLDTILSLLLSFYYVFYAFNRLKIKILINKSVLNKIPEIIKYSFYIFLLAIVNQFYWRSGQIILGINGDLRDISIHSISMLLINNVLLITPLLSQIMIPKTTSLVYPFNLKKLSNLMINVGRFQFGTLLSIFLIFLLIGKNFINLWLGNEFQDLYYITLIYLLSISIQTNLTTATNALKALNLHKNEALINLVSSSIFVILSFYFSINFGLYGVAFSSFVSIFLIQGGLLILLIKKKLGLNMFKVIITIVSPYFFPIIIFISLNHFLYNFIEIQNWMDFLFFFISFGSLFLFLTFIFVLTKYEKKFFLNFLTISFKRVISR